MVHFLRDDDGLLVSIMSDNWREPFTEFGGHVIEEELDRFLDAKEAELNAREEVDK